MARDKPTLMPERLVQCVPAAVARCAVATLAVLFRLLVKKN